MKINFTIKSGNGKTGNIPVSITEESSCPTTCPFRKQGCYGKFFPLSFHWKKHCSKEWEQFIQEIKQLNPGQLWRHNQAGDLPGYKNKINNKQMRQLIAANKGKKGYTYTHKPVLNHVCARNNKKLIKESNKKGFCVNLSASNLKEVDKLLALNIAPVVVTLPINAPRISYTPKGNKVVKCPAQCNEQMNCANCKLCAMQNRPFVVGFEAHGHAKKFVSELSKF